jgi:hypothetical protein
MGFGPPPAVKRRSSPTHQAASDAIEEKEFVKIGDYLRGIPGASHTMIN